MSLQQSETAGKSNTELANDLLETCDDCGEILPPANPNGHSCGKQESVTSGMLSSSNTTTPTSHERDLLIAEDDGDPLEKVLTVHGTRSGAAYHARNPDDPEKTNCCTATNGTGWNTVTRREAHGWNRHPCSRCFGTPTPSEIRSRVKQQQAGQEQQPEQQQAEQQAVTCDD